MPASLGPGMCCHLWHTPRTGARFGNSTRRERTDDLPHQATTTHNSAQQGACSSRGITDGVCTVQSQGRMVRVQTWPAPRGCRHHCPSPGMPPAPPPPPPWPSAHARKATQGEGGHPAPSLAVGWGCHPPPQHSLSHPHAPRGGGVGLPGKRGPFVEDRKLVLSIF